MNVVKLGGKSRAVPEAGKHLFGEGVPAGARREYIPVGSSANVLLAKAPAGTPSPNRCYSLSWPVIPLAKGCVRKVPFQRVLRASSYSLLCRVGKGSSKDTLIQQVSLAGSNSHRIV